MGKASQVRKYMEFLPVKGSNLIAFILKDNANGDSWKNIIVAFNGRHKTARLAVPTGKYTIVCKNGTIKAEGIQKIKGKIVSIPAHSALIMHQ